MLNGLCFQLTNNIQHFNKEIFKQFWGLLEIIEIYKLKIVGKHSKFLKLLGHNMKECNLGVEIHKEHIS